MYKYISKEISQNDAIWNEFVLRDFYDIRHRNSLFPAISLIFKMEKNSRWLKQVWMRGFFVSHFTSIWNEYRFLFNIYPRIFISCLRICSVHKIFKTCSNLSDQFVGTGCSRVKSSHLFKDHRTEKLIRICFK